VVLELQSEVGEELHLVEVAVQLVVLVEVVLEVDMVVVQVLVQVDKEILVEKEDQLVTEVAVAADMLMQEYQPVVLVEVVMAEVFSLVDQMHFPLVVAVAVVLTMYHLHLIEVETVVVVEV
jgi:hypothetical protein